MTPRMEKTTATSIHAIFSKRSSNSGDWKGSPEIKHQRRQSKVVTESISNRTHRIDTTRRLADV